MTTRVNLVPTTVTDKNGRTTTVHKRVDGSKSASKALAASAPVLTPPSAPAGTPLAPIVPLSKRELKAFDDLYLQLANERGGSSGNYRIAIREPHDDKTKALAWRILQSGVVSENAIFNLLFSYNVNAHLYHTTHTSEAMLHTSLHVFEKLAEEDPSLVETAGPTLGEVVQRSLRGYCCNANGDLFKTMASIDTEEKLASLAAITIFIYNANNNKAYEQMKRGAAKDINNTRVDGDVMANKTLDLYLRENPQEVHRVVSYMNSREMGTKVRDTKALIEYLKENEHSTLDQGWL